MMSGTGKEEPGDGIEDIVAAMIERAELHRTIWRIANDLRGLFDDVDVNSTRLGNTVAQRNAKLAKIMDAIGDLPLEHGAAQIDAFGDAYEYLMTMYASSAGKSGGEFSKAQEVADVLANLALDGRRDVSRVCDALYSDWIHKGKCFALAA